MNILIDTYTPTNNKEITTPTYCAPTTYTVTPTTKDTYTTTTKTLTTDLYKSQQGLTLDDIMQQAAVTDVALQKDYMVLMSHCVSGEDYEKMSEDGFNPADTDAETYVTIVDKIKATLASSGVDVEGYTDTLDVETLEAITGAITQALEIKNMSDDMAKYLVENNQSPTIENLYKAGYSTTDTIIQPQGYYSDGAYYARKADDTDIDNLEPYLEQAVAKAGFSDEEKEQALEIAKWLVQSGIEVNSDNLVNAYNIKNIKLPPDKDCVTKMCINAVINGKSPYEANLTGEKTIDEESRDLIDKVNSITDSQIHTAVEKGIDLNIRNIAKINPDNETDISSKPTEASLKEIQAKRQMEEIRLMMSEEANRHLLRQGISIDTTKLSDLVDMLKETEAQIKEALYKGGSYEANVELENLYNETLSKTEQIADMPAFILGTMAKQIGTYSIDSIYELGAGTNKAIEYEKLMTSPRSDLGDSIKKAFKNVDDILNDLGLETSEPNRRAVRILGYNSMEITKQNIDTVKQADRQVNDVMDKMTPANTLKMIREQKNPLNMTMDELDDYLSQNSDNTKSSEKYSKFLQKLDQSGDITSNEREAYIGIYRLFNQIEKSDGAVIGSIVASGAQMNFKNMLSAVRTSHNKNMDITVDDGFGALSEMISVTKPIDVQINEGFGNNADNDEHTKNQEKYYASLSGEINDELSDKTDVSQLKDINLTAQTTIENFKDMLEDIRLEKEDKYGENMYKEYMYKEYMYSEYKEDISEAMQASDEVIQELLDYSQPVTTYNLEAAMLLSKAPNELFGKINKISDYKDTDDIFDEADNFIDGLEDKETVYDLYNEIIKSARETLDNYVYSPNATYVDIKAAQGMYKELSLMGGLSREENYQIPMNIDGEVTNVNLKIYHNKSEAGKVAVTLENETLGKVAAEFMVDEERISGIVACENDIADSYLKGVPYNMEEAFADKNVNISLVKSKSVNLEKFGEDRDKNSSTVSTSKLYKTAKVFLKSLKDIGGNQYEN